MPTALEKGYDIVYSTWFGLRGPKGIPPAAKAKLVNAFEKSAKDPQVISLLAKIDCDANYLSPEEQEKKSQAEYKLYMDVWGKIGKK